MNQETMVAGVTEADAGSGLPGISGFTLSSAFGFFNVVVGLMIVASFLFFFGGLSGYLARLGIESRIDGLHAMYWGVTIMFVLVILLAVVHYLQVHPAIVFSIIAVLIIAVIAYAVKDGFESGGEEKPKK